jgi:SAM-dependent methyltransferase
VTLHPLAERFALVAGAYERGRPDYPPAVVGAIAAELGLQPGARVLDLAAGTGKLARALMAFGFDAVAVEPQGPLRDLLASAISPERALEGVAEAIPLADGSVALVTVADAFHWFEPQAALAEIKRVLAPGGGLAVLATVPELGVAPWGKQLGELMEAARPEHPFCDGPPWRQSVAAAGGFTEPREIRVTFDAPIDAARVLDYLSSVSWVAALPEPEREELMGRVQECMREGETPSAVPIHVHAGLTTLA